jgi:hypothetical protein
MGIGQEPPSSQMTDSYKEGFERMLSLGLASCGLPLEAGASILYKTQIQNIEAGTSPSVQHSHFALLCTQL